MEDFLLGERDAAIFEQSKNSKYMQNVATKMKVGNGANEVDVTNSHDYKTSLRQIVKNVTLFFKQNGCEVYFVSIIT